MIRDYPAIAEKNIEDATRILTHYVMQALPDADRGDTLAEMRDVVEAIVDAAILTAREQREEA